MVKNSQAASQVISPQISTTQTVFSRVKSNVSQRLNKSVSAPNSIPHIIAAGRASVPRAGISNPLVASVSGYSPLPGSRPANHMRLDVQNIPAPKVDSVADAIQRYLGISPRNEPTADPLDEATVARHPQQLLQAADRWADARYYQFSANGLERYQFQSDFRAWGGGLELNIENRGQADISAPAHRSPLAVRGPASEGADPDLVFAAQRTMADLAERRSEPVEWLKAGAPINQDDPYFDPAYAAQNAMADILARQGEPIEWTSVGAPIFQQSAYFDPAYAAQNAMGRIRDLMADIGEVVVGSGDRAGNPAYAPGEAFKTAMARTRQSLEDIGPPPVKVGAPLSTEDVLASPNKAWATTTNVNKGLEAEHLREEDKSGLARYYRPRGLDQAYLRAIRIMEEMEVGVMRPAIGAVDSRS